MECFVIGLHECILHYEIVKIQWGPEMNVMV